jgi:hypothetical protein
MSEQMRNEFEAWWLDKFADDAAVSEWDKATAWIGWQASRAALCVELPVMLYPYPGQDEDGKLTDRDRNVTISHCADAIHAAGVKTK